jgi:putative DNA methylase
VRRYGKWMRDEAEKHIGHLYPKVNVGGIDCMVIAWIWARTVTCPNPACSGTMPLVRSFWLGKKKGKERYVKAIPDGKRIRFEIHGPEGVPSQGTVGRNGAICLICETPVPLSYIRDEGKGGRMGAQLMAIAAEGKRQRYYVAPSEEHEKAADVPRPDDAPEGELSTHPQYMAAPRYGMADVSDLFTNRQLVSLVTLSDLVRKARQHAIDNGAESAYADAITTYLAFVITRVADRNSSICSWDSSPKMESLRNTFARQAVPMSWDFGEGNVFGNGSGNIGDAADWTAGAIDTVPTIRQGDVEQADAASRDYRDVLVATDPPYYDNVPYADLSDFFYVWLRRSLSDVYPALLGTMLAPKTDELVANYLRQDGKGNAERFFEDGFTNVFKSIRKTTPSGYPITVFYAFKQTEADGDGGDTSTGWETLLEGMITSGWTVTGTWPVRTELSNRPRGYLSNALGSSIVLACRPRPDNAAFTDLRGLIAALREELPAALDMLEHYKVSPVDMRQAAIGPGMAVFSRYSRVNQPDGTRMGVKAALKLINQVFDAKMSHLEGDVSADTRWCVDWFKAHGFDTASYDEAEKMSRGADTSVDGLERAGVLVSRGGKVKLRSVLDIPNFYDPREDERTSEWEICLHLAKQLDKFSVESAASVMAAARLVSAIDLDTVHELAYLLYSIADKKAWTETALLFNKLGTSWTDIEDLSRKVAPGGGGPSGGELALEFGSDDGDE